MNSYYMKEIDLLDFLAELIEKWKYVLLAMTAGMLLLGAYGAYKTSVISNQTTNTLAVTEAVEASRSALTEREAVEVDQIFKQYVLYQQYKAQQEQYYTSFQLHNPQVLKRLKYYVTSDIVDAGSIFTASALSDNDYDEIKKIISGEENDQISAFHFEDIIQFYNRPDNRTVLEMKNSMPIMTQVTVSIFAQDKEASEAIQQIVQDAFEKKYEQLKKTDHIIELELLDASYVDGLQSYEREAIAKNVQERQQYLYNVNTADTLLLGLQGNFVSKLSPEQTAYYDALVNDYYAEKSIKMGTEAQTEVSEMSGQATNDERVQTEEALSWRSYIQKKYIFVGAILGLIIVLVIFGMRYITDNTLKTINQIKYEHKLVILDEIFYEKKRNLVSPVVRKIRKAVPSADNVQVNMLSHDIEIMLQQLEKTVVYFLLTSEDKRDIDITERTVALLKDRGICAGYGYPFNNAEELDKISGGETVIVMTHLRKSKNDIISRSLELCTRYNKSILGTVIVGEC